MDDTYNRFREFIYSNSLILEGDRVLLSLSAGKDSMFMLHLLLKLQEELRFEIGIFHLNHLTRGEASDKDELLVREIGAAFNIPCCIRQFDFKKNKIPSVSFEEHARNVRYSLLKQTAEAENYSKIATAHNFNDNAETLLMRILSGTGIAGLKGILPLNGNIIRPILFAEKEEIYEYLRRNKIEWREDMSNEDNVYLRNHIRNVIIPSIRERFPSAEESLNNLSLHAIENQMLMASLTERLYPEAVIKIGEDVIIDIDSFSDDIPLIKYFLSAVLYEYYGIKMNISLFSEIIRRYKINSANMLLYEKDNFRIRKGLLKNRKTIYIDSGFAGEESAENWEYDVYPVEDTVINIREIKREIRLSFVDYEFYVNNKDNPDIVFIQPDTDLKSIIIRNRRPGDRIKIESGTKKIKELMIEKKLDSRIKNSIPLIVADNMIAAYLPGFVNSNNNRVACNFHIRNDTKRILAFFFKDY